MRYSRPAAILLLTCFLAPFVPGCQALDRLASGSRRRAESKQSARATIPASSNGRAPAVMAAPSPRPPVTTSLERAALLESQGLYSQALAEFERAIEHNPRLTVAYMSAAEIHRKQGNLDKAEPMYAQAAVLEPKNFSAQYLHGLTLQLLDRISEAVSAYLRALAIKPGDFNANLNLGTAFLQLGEPAQALPYAQRAVQLEGRDGAARTNLGAIYAALNRHEDAVTEFQQAAELTPLSAPLLLNLADSLGKTGRYEEMVNTLEQLGRTEPSAAGYERLGTGLFKLRRYDEALTAFRKSLEIDPNHYPALNGVGVCLLNQWIWSKQEDEAARDEALRSLRRSLQIERNQPKIMELVGRYK